MCGITGFIEPDLTASDKKRAVGKNVAYSSTIVVLTIPESGAMTIYFLDITD
jgi:hypothetical protein